MHVLIVGGEALVRGQPRAQREVGLDARSVALELELERRQQRAQAHAVIRGGVRERLEACARRVAQVGARQSGSQLLLVAFVALQREVQAAAPLVEGCSGLREQPWDRVEPGKFDAATGAAEAVAADGERLIAARTREQLEKKQRRSSGRFKWRLGELSAHPGRAARREPVHRSRYVKPRSQGKATVTRPSLAR